jgi:hypothetical protein
MEKKSQIQIRSIKQKDFKTVLDMNNSAVPAVNQLNAEDLEWYSEVAKAFFVAEHEGKLLGFLVGLDGPGLPYESENYKWFSERYERFLYVDRVVVDPTIFSQGLGQSFYREFVEQSVGYQFLCAEVNLHPRNDRSLRFHEKFGFTSVGEQDTDGGKKTVQMLEYELS